MHLTKYNPALLPESKHAAKERMRELDVCIEQIGKQLDETEEENPHRDSKWRTRAMTVITNAKAEYHFIEKWLCAQDPDFALIVKARKRMLDDYFKDLKKQGRILAYETLLSEKELARRVEVVKRSENYEEHMRRLREARNKREIEQQQLAERVREERDKLIQAGIDPSDTMQCLRLSISLLQRLNRHYELKEGEKQTVEFLADRLRSLGWKG